MKELLTIDVLVGNLMIRRLADGAYIHVTEQTTGQTILLDDEDALGLYKVLGEHLRDAGIYYKDSALVGPPGPPGPPGPQGERGPKGERGDPGLPPWYSYPVRPTIPTSPIPWQPTCTITNTASQR